jgi:hypothetical protein
MPTGLLTWLSPGPVTTGTSRPGHLGTGSHTTRPTSCPGTRYSHTRIIRAPGFDQFFTSSRAGPTRPRIVSTALRPSPGPPCRQHSRPPPPLLCSSRHAALLLLGHGLDAPRYTTRSPASVPSTIRHGTSLQSGVVHSATPDLALGPGRFGWRPPYSDCSRLHPPARVRGAGQEHS